MIVIFAVMRKLSFFTENKIAKNASWIIVSRSIQAVLGLITSMLVARFLGPSNFGIINYAESVVAFVVPIMNLGLSNILVQELTNHPEEEGKIIGTSILMSVFSSFFCIGSVITYSLIADAGEPITNLVVGLFSLMLLAQAFELIQYWYQAKLLSKYMALVSFFAYLIVSIYKFVIVLINASVSLFAISNSIDYLLIAIALLIIYSKMGGQRLSFSKIVGKRMIGKSKHFILSSLMITIFAQTDKIMIKLMINEEAVGYYSAAVRCAALTGFLFTAIIDSFRPVIYQRKKDNQEQAYEIKIKQLYCVVVYLALAQSVAMTLLSRFIIQVLYGSDYTSSVLALRIIVWYTTFSYIGGIRDIWILGEEKQKYLFLINSCGALMNVILNLFFIRAWGIYGAALASLLTQIFTNIVMTAILGPLRHNNTILLRSLNPKVLFM